MPGDHGILALHNANISQHHRVFGSFFNSRLGMLLGYKIGYNQFSSSSESRNGFDFKKPDWAFIKTVLSQTVTHNTFLNAVHTCVLCAAYILLWQGISCKHLHLLPPGDNYVT